MSLVSVLVLRAEKMPVVVMGSVRGAILLGGCLRSGTRKAKCILRETLLLATQGSFESMGVEWLEALI